MSSARNRKRLRRLTNGKYLGALRVYRGQDTRSRQAQELAGIARRLTKHAKNRIAEDRDNDTGVITRRMVRDEFSVIKKPDGSFGVGVSKTIPLSDAYRTIGLATLIPGIDPAVKLELNPESGKLVHFRIDAGTASRKKWGEPALDWGNTGSFVTIQYDQATGAVTKTLAIYTFGIEPKPDGSLRVAVIAKDQLHQITSLGLVAYSSKFEPSLEGSHRYGHGADRVSISADNATFANAGNDTRAIFVRSPNHSIFAQSATLSDDQVRTAGNWQFNVGNVEVNMVSGGIVAVRHGLKTLLNDLRSVDMAHQYLEVTDYGIAGIKPDVVADYIALKVAIVSRVTGAKPDTFTVQMGYKAAGQYAQTVPTHIEPGNPEKGEQRVEAWTSLGRPGKNDGLLYFLPGVDHMGLVSTTDPRMVALGPSDIGIYRGYSGEAAKVINYKGYSSEAPVFINRSPANGMMHVDNNLLGPDRQPQGGLRIRLSSDRAPA